MQNNGKKIMKWSFVAIVVLLALWLILFLVKDLQKPETQEPEAKENIISRNGLHWHSELAIYIKGEKQKIPADVGIGRQYAGRPSFNSIMGMTDIHTHDGGGTIHLEFNGVVKEEDMKIENFFKVWEKRFNANCIFEYCNGGEGTLKMFVNGAESGDFENYIMKDGDKIEIRYE